jgi:hypothetical protein
VLRRHASQAAAMIHRMLCEGRVSPPALVAACDHRMFWWKKGVIPALCKLAAVVIHRMLWCEEGCAILRCIMHAAVMITECSGGRRCAIPARMYCCCCDPQNALARVHPCAAMQARCCCDSMPGGRVCYPALPCKLAAVVIHRMLWCKEGCYPCAVMHASCCHDPQNALVEEVYLRCHASSCCHDPQNALVEEGCATLRCHASSLLL